MLLQTERYYAGDIVKAEADGRYSREALTILAGAGTDRVLAIGTVLACITKGAPVAAAVAGNTGTGAVGAVTLGHKAKLGVYRLTCTAIAAPTPGAAVGAAVAGNAGNGTITAAPAVGAGAKVGVYHAVCIEPAADLGKFLVSDPDGVEVGVATVGAQFATGGLTFTIADGNQDFASGDSFTIAVAAVPGNGGIFKVVDPEGNRLGNDLYVGVAYVSEHLNLTIADGVADFVVGDAFTVTIPAGSGKAKAIDFAAVDGSQEAAGILLAGITAPNGVDAVGVALVRHATIAPSKLVWPAGATSDQKNAALAQLEAQGIITREEA
jgi:hypothetical protein